MVLKMKLYMILMTLLTVGIKNGVRSQGDSIESIIYVDLTTIVTSLEVKPP